MIVSGAADTQVLACFLVAGESDYILRVAARDIASTDADTGICLDKCSATAKIYRRWPYALRMESIYSFTYFMRQFMLYPLLIKLIC